MNSYRSRRGSGCQLHVEAIVSHLKDSAQLLLAGSRVPLQELLRQSAIAEYSVEELFGLISEQYVKRQDETSQMWQLLSTGHDNVADAIQSLERQEIEWSMARQQIDALKEEHFRKTAALQDIIDTYRNELTDLENRVVQTERELLQTNEQKQSLEQLYQEIVVRRTSLSSRHLPEPDCATNLEDKQEQQNEVILLEMKISELRTQLLLKDELISQKETAKMDITEKLKTYRERINAADNSNRFLQQTNLRLADENFELRQQITEIQKQLDVLAKWNQCLETRVTEGEEDHETHDYKTARKCFTLFPVNSEKVLRLLESPQQKASLATEIGGFCFETEPDKSVDQGIGMLQAQNISKSPTLSSQTRPSLRNPPQFNTPEHKSHKEHPEDRQIVRTVVEICRRCSSNKKKLHIVEFKQLPTFLGMVFGAINRFSSGVAATRLNRKRIGHFSVL